MLIKKVSSGYLLPRFYGVAWYEWQSGQAVCLPIGVNVLAAFARNLYFTAKHAGRIVMQNPRDAYGQGLCAGRASVPTSPHIEPTEPWPRA